MHKWFPITLLALVSLISCSSPTENLTVDKFTLRDIKIAQNDTPMVRGDQQKRLYGAVTLKEHQQRLGQYYEIAWNLTGKVEHPTEPVLVIFRYLRANTGAEVKIKYKRFPAGTKFGKFEIKIIGDDYLKNGRVLAWRADLVYGGKVLESRQSYLWGK